MTKKTKAAPSVQAIEPEAIYDVELARAVPYGRLMLRPNSKVQLKGKVVSALGDAIRAYRKAS